MLISRSDTPPPSYEEAMNQEAQERTASSTVSPLPALVFAEDGAVRNVADRREPLVGDLAAGEVERPFSSATIVGACPIPDELDVSIRYHFRSRPASYAALSDAREDFVVLFNDYGALLMARDASELRCDVGASQAADLLTTIHALDVQYRIWEGIISVSTEPILRTRRAGLGRRGANPFIAMRRDLERVKERVMGCLIAPT